MGDDIRFSDEELGFLRYVRFGELPGRVPPEERVEYVETEPGRPLPQVIGDTPYSPERTY